MMTNNSFPQEERKRANFKPGEHLKLEQLPCADSPTRRRKLRGWYDIEVTRQMAVVRQVLERQPRVTGTIHQLRVQMKQ